MNVNEFQKSSMTAANQVLADFDIAPEFECDGTLGQHLVAKMVEPNLTIWIYPADLEFSLLGISARFEHQDFDSPSEMQSLFAAELRSRLRSGNPPEAIGSNTPWLDLLRSILELFRRIFGKTRP